MLQFIFQSLFRSGPIQRDSLCLIQSDRHYARPATPPPAGGLAQYNSDLFNRIQGSPRSYESQNVANQDALYSLLLHRTSFIDQFHEINKYLVRLAFDEIEFAAIRNLMSGHFERFERRLH